MRIVDFSDIIKEAWDAYQGDQTVESVEDISARVSTNHVYKITFEEGGYIIAKLSYFGKYEHFKEDHSIINTLAAVLPSRFEGFLARSMVDANGEVFTYRHTDDLLDAWVVFYNVVHIEEMLPKRMEERHIRALGKELATFHASCNQVMDKLPRSTKTLRYDVDYLLRHIETEEGRFEHRNNLEEIKNQAETFFEQTGRLRISKLDQIPVFVDWNIGNFSVDKELRFHSRWDYDWFRMCSRVFDFYFFSRVVSDVGDKTFFSYYITTLMEDRFMMFLEEYHKVYPLNEAEVYLIKEAYRFFILNYVIKDGRYFFHEIYATRLQKEAYEIYFPSIDEEFNADKILDHLHIKKTIHHI